MKYIYATTNDGYTHAWRTDERTVQVSKVPAVCGYKSKASCHVHQGFGGKVLFENTEKPCLGCAAALKGEKK